MIDLYTVGFGEQKEATIDILGGKGYHLNIMSNLGVNVPPAIIVPTTYCGKVHNKMISAMEVAGDVFDSLDPIVSKFGYLPLFSIRSGAKVSLPGMLDTILNVGLCETTIPTWEARIGKRATWDSYRRLIQMFGDVVFNIDSQKYEDIISEVKKKNKVTFDTELSVEALQLIAKRFLEITPDFPQTFKMQLRRAISAVFNSWHNTRAIEYRNIHNIPHDIGTAVIIQAMVFGNLNNDSGTGVLFTRNPSTGENIVYGEYLVNAQGEDVVSGVRTPEPLSTLQQWNSTVYFELLSVVKNLEAHYRDVQDVEFTIQDKKLYILQTRTAKRTAVAAVNIAVDLLIEGVLTNKEVFSRITYDQYLKAQHPSIDPTFSTPPNSIGIPASSGFARGTVVFSSKKAILLSKDKPVILVTKETTPEDIAGMNASVGIFTQTGGASSHAALIARGMDKVCVVGCLDLKPTGDSTKWNLKNDLLVEGETQITIEGTTGKVWVDVQVPTIGATDNTAIKTINKLVDEVVSYIPKVTEGTSGYLDTSGYDNNTEKLKEVVSNFKGIISLGSKKDTMDAWDSYLFELVTTFNDAEIKVTKLSTILDNSTGNTIDLCGFHLADFMADSIKSKGFKTVKQVSTLEDLVLATDVVKLTKDFKPSEASKEVVRMKSLIGEPVKYLELVQEYDPGKNYDNILVVATKDSVLKSVFST